MRAVQNREKHGIEYVCKNLRIHSARGPVSAGNRRSPLDLSDSHWVLIDVACDHHSEMRYRTQFLCCRPGTNFFTDVCDVSEVHPHGTARDFLGVEQKPECALFSPSSKRIYSTFYSPKISMHRVNMSNLQACVQHYTKVLSSPEIMTSCRFFPIPPARFM